MANNSGKIITIIITAFLFITFLILYLSVQEIKDYRELNKSKEDYLKQQISDQQEIITALEKENKTYKDDNILLKDYGK